MTRSSPRAALSALGAVTAVHLLALGFDWPAVSTATKPLLMPVLAVYAVLAARPGRPVLLVAAVLCGWAGDVLLMLDAPTAFLAGMGAFAAGHVLYQTLFLRQNDWRTRKTAVAGGVYAVLWAALLLVLWPGLPAELRVPVAVYSLLLTGTAVVAVSVNTRAAVGGALFLLSDTLIATGIAHTPRPPGVDVWIMSTYVLGQYLLVSGALAPRPMPAKAPDALKNPA